MARQLPPSFEESLSHCREACRAPDRRGACGSRHRRSPRASGPRSLPGGLGLPSRDVDSLVSLRRQVRGIRSSYRKGQDGRLDQNRPQMREEQPAVVASRQRSGTNRLQYIRPELSKAVESKGQTAQPMAGPNPEFGRENGGSIRSRPTSEFAYPADPNRCSIVLRLAIREGKLRPSEPVTPSAPGPSPVPLRSSRPCRTPAREGRRVPR